MTDAARFLHITDTHLKINGADFSPDDRKVDPHLEPQTRANAIDAAFARVAEQLGDREERLDAVVFCGDALLAGARGGDARLLELILKHFSGHGIVPERIVAVPGNHDIPVGTKPGSPERYEDFLRVWRGAKCVTPWFDGIDPPVPIDWSNHVLVGPKSAWAVIALNSCNWSHAEAIPKALQSVWASIPKALAAGDLAKEEALAKELTKLVRYDMARVSREQLEALRAILRSLPPADDGQQLKMLALHHHLRTPSLREEVKAFADISNLEQLRTFVAQQDIRVLLHGHKHVSRSHFDYVEEQSKAFPHKVLMIAGATFSDSDQSDAMRIVQLRGLPWVPTIQIETHAIPWGGITTSSRKDGPIRLWSYAENTNQAAIVIQGSNFDEVYARVRAAAEDEAKNKTLIVQLDVEDDSAIKRLPMGYPNSFEDESQRVSWLDELVQWWQLPQSQLQARVPYIHGTRLYRYSSNLNQIERICDLLKDNDTSRAIALLIDPALDFKDDPGERVEFASFCLVQFSRQPAEIGQHRLDVIAYYRAQEMVRWWPINVAELRHLQMEVVKKIGGKPGRITTIAASARSAARSPTHVAMPIIDRWLDQAPEKYFVLATAMLQGARSDGRELTVARQWISELQDLRRAAVEPPPDGGPVVAIDGPRRLAKYLRSGRGANAGKCMELAGVLDDLARYGASAGELKRSADSEQWATHMLDLLDKVVAQSCALLSLPPVPKAGAASGAE